jgi:hypothetical protein
MAPTRDDAAPLVKGSGLQLVPFSKIKLRRVQFAIEGLVPISLLTLIAGTVDLGKSTLLDDWTARWTRGQLPGAFAGIPVNVLVASTEDDPETVIGPRLLAAGADLDRVFWARVPADERDLILPDDLPALEPLIKKREIRALRLDPVLGYLPNRVDVWKESDVRRALRPLQRIVRAHGMAFLGVMHFSKAQVDEVLMRIAHSGAFVQVARSVLVVVRDFRPGADSTARLLVHPKCNVGPKQTTTVFRLENRTVDDEEGAPIKTVGLTWIGEAPEITPRDLAIVPTVAGKRVDPRARQSKDDVASDVIQEMVSKGPQVPWKIYQAGKAKGLGVKVLRRVARDLGVTMGPQVFGGPWVWALPTSLGSAFSMSLDPAQTAQTDKGPAQQCLQDKAPDSLGNVSRHTNLYDDAAQIGATGGVHRKIAEDLSPSALLLLARAERYGYPLMTLSSGITIAAGKDAWEVFALEAPASEYNEAAERLQALPHTGQASRSLEEVPRPAKPTAYCHACGGRRFWLPTSRSRWICDICHPPMAPSLVLEWYAVPT